MCAIRSVVLLLALLLTPLGSFECQSIRCQVTPPGLTGYFTVAGMLLITSDNRPFGTVECEALFDSGRALEKEYDIWFCGYLSP